MKCNVGKVDRVIRLLIGLVVMLIGCLIFRSYWGLVGLIPVLTAAFGCCPLYSLLHISTCRGGSCDCNR